MAFLALAMMIVGLGFKVSAAPFHVWTPDVYQGAPAPVVGFMSTAPKAAAFAVLLRITFTGFPAMQHRWAVLMWVLAALSMTIGNLGALLQTDVKRMLAYSSIAHAGYLLVAFTAFPSWGIAAACYYTAAYAAMNVGAFAVITQASGYNETLRTIDDFRGLATRRPVLAALLAFFLLSLIGIPFTGGFFGKFYVFSAALQAGNVWLAVVGLLNSGVACFYYLRLLAAVYAQTRTIPLRSRSIDSGTNRRCLRAADQRGCGPRPDPDRRRDSNARHPARPLPPPRQLREQELGRQHLQTAGHRSPCRQPGRSTRRRPNRVVASSPTQKAGFPRARVPKPLTALLLLPLSHRPDLAPGQQEPTDPIGIAGRRLERRGRRPRLLNISQPPIRIDMLQHPIPRLRNHRLIDLAVQNAVVYAPGHPKRHQRRSRDLRLVISRRIQQTGLPQAVRPLDLRHAPQPSPSSGSHTSPAPDRPSADTAASAPVRPSPSPRPVTRTSSARWLLLLRR